MSTMGPEEFLERMEEVGAKPLDNQDISNSLAKGVEATSLVGRLPGRESVVAEMQASLPDPEVVEVTTDNDLALEDYTISTNLPGLS